MPSRLRDELKDKEYRDAFVAASVRNGIAFQLRAMRASRDWDQKRLAREMGNGKLQPLISRYENPDYGRFSVSTLLDLAKALDVGLIVRFASFPELIERDEKFTDVSLNVESYNLRDSQVVPQQPYKKTEGTTLEVLSGIETALLGIGTRPEQAVRGVDIHAVRDDAIFLAEMEPWMANNRPNAGGISAAFVSFVS